MASVQMCTKSANANPENDGLAGLHKHCVDCYSFKLCSGDDGACEFIQCSTHCGAVFHGCKESEHLELCPNIRVPCLNAGNGCSLEMMRRDLGTHLETCPASVVMCMAEWNRWPVYSSERRRHIPFRQRNPYAEEGQLDYDLTLRDQRMLGNLGKISRKTRLTLRNTLTRRYPAVPIPSTINSGPQGGRESSPSDVLDLGDDIEFHGVRKDPMLSKQMIKWQNDLDERLKDKEKIIPYWDYPELEKGNIHKHCAYCYDVACPKSFADGFVDSNDPKGKACEVIDCRWKCGARYHQCKGFEHQMLCLYYEEPDDFAWMYRGMKGAKRESRKATQKKQVLKPVEDPLIGPDRSNITTGELVNGHFVPDPPPMPKSIFNHVRLDVKLETITRLQTKPRSMYTFVCAQEFRRDEFPHHSRNIHNDIHGGMNNWIEHRCPLACHGCSFSARRLYPHDFNHTLMFSPASESFGVKSINLPQILTVSSKNHSTSLPGMPNEILIKILRYLDPFTLCNLAVTSIGMREVCASMLDEKGCVTLQWERVKLAGQIKWQVAYKRWFFSTALKPIDKWVFADESVSNHLKVCPYNIVLRKTRKEVMKSDQYDKVLDDIKNSLRLKRNNQF
eukprot:maker-scaffold81_size397536-snap-gene-0.19 protein:Tk08525 transcript:maker-scaffold81_size397536-snap-gene-0.19-mRNA-1 annotation:"low quality protein: f-box only protein 40"